MAAATGGCSAWERMDQLGKGEVEREQTCSVLFSGLQKSLGTRAPLVGPTRTGCQAQVKRRAREPCRVQKENGVLTPGGRARSRGAHRLGASRDGLARCARRDVSARHAWRPAARPCTRCTAVWAPVTVGRPPRCMPTGSLVLPARRPWLQSFIKRRIPIYTESQDVVSVNPLHDKCRYCRITE